MFFNRQFFILALVLLAVLSARASGFGLYEASTKSHALNGAALGRAVDASANFINPATLTDFTNVVVTTGFVTQHPRARMKVDGHKSTTMDPGAFLLPNFHVAVPLPWEFAFGLGLMPEYGLGSEYTKSWALAPNSHDTTVQSLTLNPNLACRLTDKWSVGGGLRFLFFDFEQHSYPMKGVRQRLKGDNDMEDFGWQVGTSYDLLENFAVGLVYKSETEVNVVGTSRMTMPYITNGRAATELDLPQSLTAGFNWDVVENWHLGTSVAWTDWSSVGTLDFHLNTVHKPIKLEWEDTYRVVVAPSWDFAKNWTWMWSYGFETDCCGHQDSTMLPPSDRHMLATGLAWHATANLELALSYGLILMNGHASRCTVNDVGHHYTAHAALSHAAGFSVSYAF